MVRWTLNGARRGPNNCSRSGAAAKMRFRGCGGARGASEEVEAGAVDGAFTRDQYVVLVLAQQEQRVALAGDAVKLEDSAYRTRNSLETL